MKTKISIKPNNKQKKNREEDRKRDYDDCNYNTSNNIIIIINYYIIALMSYKIRYCFFIIIIRSILFTCYNLLIFISNQIRISNTKEKSKITGYQIKYALGHIYK